MAATPEHAARVLGLDDQATLEDVRRVRKKLALKYHPDRAADQERATRHMARINAAADTLTAHLRKRARPAAKKPGFADFRARRQPQNAYTDGGAPRDGAASQTKPERETPRTTKADRQKRSTRKTTNTTASDYRAERSRVRVATTSYASVLSGIGPRHAGPRIDIRVLGFQTAA